MIEKDFSDFSQTLHTESTHNVIIFIFGIWCENFLVCLKIEIEFENLGFFVQSPNLWQAYFFIGLVLHVLCSSRPKSSRGVPGVLRQLV